jgi:hypothetical protein
MMIVSGCEIGTVCALAGMNSDPARTAAKMVVVVETAIAPSCNQQFIVK